jgi:hypothetical protein
MAIADAAAAVPVVAPDPICPRCGTTWTFVNLSGAGAAYRCMGCEWQFTFSVGSPSGTTNAAITANTSTALSVASGGAAFTNGMFLFISDAANSEVVMVGGTPTGTSVPAFMGGSAYGNGALANGFAFSHLSGVSFGKLVVTPALGVQAAQPVSGWPTLQPGSF